MTGEKHLNLGFTRQKQLIYFRVFMGLLRPAKWLTSLTSMPKWIKSTIHK